MSENIKIALMGIAGTGLGSFLTWFFTRNKTDAETELITHQKENEQLEFWQKSGDGMKDEITQLRQELTARQQTINKLSKDLLDMHEKINILEEKYDRLKLRATMYKSALKELNPNHAFLKLDELLPTSEERIKV